MNLNNNSVNGKGRGLGIESLHLIRQIRSANENILIGEQLNAYSFYYESISRYFLRQFLTGLEIKRNFGPFILVEVR